MTGIGRFAVFAPEPSKPTPARGGLTAVGGTAKLENLDLRLGDGRLTGSGRFDLRQGRQLNADLAASRWPVTIGDVGLQISGEATGSLDVLAATAQAEVQATSDLMYRGHGAGQAVLRGRVQERQLELDHLRLDAKGGTLEGEVSLPLDDWTALSADLTATELNLEALAATFELDGGLQGTASGTITAGPSRDPRALGPLTAEASLVFESASCNSIELSSLDLRAQFGEDRCVLERGAVRAAGGAIELWASSGLHAGERYLQAHASCQDLELDQLVNAIRKQEDHVEGRLSGQVSGAGYLAENPRLFGEGLFELTDSDLLALPVVETLYGALNIVSKRETRGSGTAQLRLIGNSLELSRLRYSNRGLEILLRGMVHDVLQGGESPVSGVGIGLVRPLRDLNLPLSDYLDRMLAGAQTGSASVKVSGTVRDPQTEVVPLADVQQGVARLLGSTND